MAPGPIRSPRYLPLVPMPILAHFARCSRINDLTFCVELNGHKGIKIVLCIFNDRADISWNSSNSRCNARAARQIFSTTMQMSSAKAPAASSFRRCFCSLVNNTSIQIASRRPDKGHHWRTPECTRTPRKSDPPSFNKCSLP